MDTQPDDLWQPLLDSLSRLKASWPGGEWTWDARFAAVASSFAAELEPAARASAQHAMTRGWTTKSLENAPESLRQLAERTGGLRQGQRLLAGTSDALFGLWWPWGGGDTVTLRIGFTDASVTPRLRALFGV